MNYCVECGTKLELNYLESEGMIPFCETCQAYRFPIFNTAVSMVVTNPNRDKILLIQQYQRQDNILVAGYVNKGENAEHAVAREIAEELGMSVTDITYNKSRYFEGSNTLILNYSCVAVNEDLTGITSEVDVAQWFTIEAAKTSVKPNSFAQDFLNHYLLAQKYESRR